ncbi:MAG: GNAT family N-acetyltransferase [Roseobacter sp.]
MTDTRPVSVRPLQASDKEQWSRLWKGYLAFYDTSRPAEIYDVYFDRLLSDDPQDYNGFIAEIDGDAVGLTHYLFHRHGWSIEDTCYLQDLYVDPTGRGRGIGRALIEAVYRAADENNIPSVYWLTQDFNTDARQLYDRIGIKTPFIKYIRK